MLTVWQRASLQEFKQHDAVVFALAVDGRIGVCAT